MSKLVDLIDAYKDTHGQPSDASIARAIKIAPQTLNSWRKRGIKLPPAPETLWELADLIGKDFDTVIMPAVLADTGYKKPESGQGEVRGA